ncbi:MAG TPA: GWxTD domain-containing protein [Thermoanaerobaculia bacterium]
MLQWVRSPEAYFMTAEERAEWDRKVLTPAEAQKFIEEFRRRRGEQFVKDINSRVEFSNKQFGLGNKRGAETERGRVFMLLGAPNEQKTIRANTGAQAGTGGDPSTSFQNSNLERQAVVETEWIYKSDRLPKELGVPELKVRFQTNVGRAQETIENPGLVEPYLKRMAEFISNRYAQQQSRVSVTPGPAAPNGPDPLWSATPNANGAILTGESYVSPTGRPFYATSIFVPREAAGFGEWKSALLVSLIRNANGVEVVSDRQQVDLLAYDGAGNRYAARGFELAPGKYDAVFALYSPEGTTMLASWREQFDVLPASESRAAKLLFSSRIDTLETQAPFDPFTYVATRYAVHGDRRFTLADKITFFTVVQNPAGDTPKLMQKMTITRNGKPFFKSPVEASTPTQTGPRSYLVGISFDPATFKPGKYNVELQLRDMNAPEGSELRSKGYVVSGDFEVIP